MVKSGLASPLFLCKYPQEKITIQRVVAKQADTLQQTARIRLAAGKGRSMRRKEEIEAYAENLFLPITQKHGFELVDVEYVKEAGSWYLRVYIDKEGGVTIDDCQNVSRAFNEILDRENYIDDQYIFEVSSPGLTRPLKKEKDYEKSIGRMIEIKLFSPVDKSKEYSGVLKEYDKDTVTISIDDVTKTFDRSNLAMIRWAFVDEV